jgi:Tfp pilus assembly protein PilX
VGESILEARMDLEISSSHSTSLLSYETDGVNGAAFGKDERRGVDLSLLSSSTLSSPWIIDENETLYTTTLSSSSSSSSSTTTITTPTTPTLTKTITYYSNHVKCTTSSMDDSNFHFGQQRGRFWVWPVTHSADTTNVFRMEDSSMESNA